MTTYLEAILLNPNRSLPWLDRNKQQVEQYSLPFDSPINIPSFLKRFITRNRLSSPRMETLRTHLRLFGGASPSILLIAMLFLCVSVSATKHDVGGKQGWAPNVNYTDWASHERFFVGEWLGLDFFLS